MSSVRGCYVTQSGKMLPVVTAAAKLALILKPHSSGHGVKMAVSGNDRQQVIFHKLLACLILRLIVRNSKDRHKLCQLLADVDVLAQRNSVRQANIQREFLN